jgi:aryl-alcohol dehydrogenase-like predicted oxidoreductase
MKYRKLGKTGVQVSHLSLGTNNFGGQVDERTSIQIINKAVDMGINAIDTANIYTGGKSEEIIGKALKGNRDQILLCTKVGMDAGPAPNQSGLSRKHIFWQVSKSLERLQTDYIDIYYLHRFDAETPLEETLRAMDQLVKEGKVLYAACSNFSVSQVASAQEICEGLDLERLVAVQPPYNLLRREAEADLLPYCQSRGLGVLTYSPFMGGLLTGKYTDKEHPPQGSRGERNPRYWERIKNLESFSAVIELRKIADSAGFQLSQLALPWILLNPAVTSAITGASSPEQVEENCRAAETQVPEDILKRLTQASSKHPPL